LQAFRIADGAMVAAGDLVAVMEAMKMETQVLAPRAGRLRLLAKEGDYVQAGDALMTFEA
jgi:acetyl-CoA/propionyl-CoA carboxylase biotin carboxyl carrier protein